MPQKHAAETAWGQGGTSWFGHSCPLMSLGPSPSGHLNMGSVGTLGPSWGQWSGSTWYIDPRRLQGVGSGYKHCDSALRSEKAGNSGNSPPPPSYNSALSSHDPYYHHEIQRRQLTKVTQGSTILMPNHNFPLYSKFSCAHTLYFLTWAHFRPRA